MPGEVAELAEAEELPSGRPTQVESQARANRPLSTYARHEDVEEPKINKMTDQPRQPQERSPKSTR